VIVLGLDPSLTAFGWALHDTSIPSGPGRCLAKGLSGTTNDAVFVDRYIHQREFLRTLLKTHRPDKVGIESSVFKSDYSEGMYGLFLYCNEALRMEKVDVLYLSPGQAKAHARESLKRPKGWKMDKPDMVEEAKRDTGIKRWNHNEADAYLIGRLAGRFWLLLEGVIDRSTLTPVEAHQFAEIHKYVRGKKAGRVENRGLLYREEDRFFRWSELEDTNGSQEVSAYTESAEFFGPNQGTNGNDQGSQR